MTDEIGDVGPVTLCKTCKFWLKTNYPRSGFGECRRHPPVLLPSAGRPNAAWPDTEHDHWCGDFEER